MDVFRDKTAWKVLVGKSGISNSSATVQDSVQVGEVHVCTVMQKGYFFPQLYSVERLLNKPGIKTLHPAVCQRMFYLHSLV